MHILEHWQAQDDSCRQGLLQPQWSANCEHWFTNTQRVARLAALGWRRCELFALSQDQAYHGEVAAGVESLHLATPQRVTLSNEYEALGILDNMVIRHEEAGRNDNPASLACPIWRPRLDQHNRR